MANWSVAPASQTTSAGVATSNYTITTFSIINISNPQAFGASDGGGGGTFSPASPTIPPGGTTATFTYENAAAGTYSLTITPPAGAGYSPATITVTAVVTGGVSVGQWWQTAALPWSLFGRKRLTPGLEGVSLARPLLPSYGNQSFSLSAVVASPIIGTPGEANTQPLLPFVVLGNPQVGLGTSLVPGDQQVSPTVVTNGGPNSLPPGVPTPNLYNTDGSSDQSLRPTVVRSDATVPATDSLQNMGSVTAAKTGDLKFAICPNLDGDPWNDEITLDSNVVAAVGFYTGSTFGAVYSVAQTNGYPLVQVKTTTNPNDWSGAASTIPIPGSGSPSALTGWVVSACTDHWGTVWINFNNGTGAPMMIVSRDQGKTWSVATHADIYVGYLECIGSVLYGINVDAQPVENGTYISHRLSLDGAQTW